MHLSQNIEKTLFPLKLIWFALMAALAVYAFILIYIKGFNFVDTSNIDSLKKVMIPMTIVIFVFTLFVSKNKNWLIEKMTSKKSESAPFLKAMDESDRKYLKNFGSYFVFHIILWAINESGALLGFLLSFVSGNFIYYIATSTTALIFNFVLYKPDYKQFMEGKNIV